MKFLSRLAMVLGCLATTECIADERAGDLAEERVRVADFAAEYCWACHDGPTASGQLDLGSLDLNFSANDAGIETWERVFRRLQARQMPPPAIVGEAPDDVHRPDESTIANAVDSLARLLDLHSAEHSMFPKVPSLRRLTRQQYQNAVRDLLDIPIDASRWLPADSVSDGFDNLNLTDLSPSLMNRYLAAAEEISRQTLSPGGVENGVTVRVPPDRTQAGQVDGLPVGSRGGVLVEHFFATSGQYRFQIQLSRDRDENVEGLHRDHQLDIWIDGAPAHRFDIQPPEDRRDQASVDRHLVVSLPMIVGNHRIGVTFASTGSPLAETKREPFEAQYNRHRHPRREPAVYEVSIWGPTSKHADAPENDFAAKAIQLRSIDASLSLEEVRLMAQTRLRELMVLAYRRSIEIEDEQLVMKFFDERFSGDADRIEGYRSGMTAALASILVNPNFLFRIERPSESQSSNGLEEKLDPMTLASRLSFFLFNSIPDERLIDRATSGTLADPEVLQQEVTRMLQDERSDSLTDVFATQWLYLRNLETMSPDLRQYPDFDDNLRQSMIAETKALFSHMVTEDRSILELIRPDRMFLNERLARHYGIRGVLGDHIRELPIDSFNPLNAPEEPGDAPENQDAVIRGGLLRNASVLMATSYATRTSPTVRGSWLLENVFGTPPPPPPPNIPALKETSTIVPTTVRERLAIHRANAACAACHDRIDPLGFAMESYDVLGIVRTHDNEVPIDATGQSPDGLPVRTLGDLEAAIVARPEVFATTLTEKLMTYALGRVITPHDGPAIRRIVQSAKQQNWKFSALVQGIVQSKPFLAP